MKIDVNALLGLLVLASTVLGGWIAYLKIIKPDGKSNKDRCAELEGEVTVLKIRIDKKDAEDDKRDNHIRLNKEKINRIVKRLKDKSSFNN